MTTIYQKRRAAVARALKAAGGGIALLPTAPEVARNRDSGFPYRHDSYFYYLTGFDEPGAGWPSKPTATARCFASPRTWSARSGTASGWVPRPPRPHSV